MYFLCAFMRICLRKLFWFMRVYVHINVHKFKILHTQRFERALFLTISQCAFADNVTIIAEEAMATSNGCAADSCTQFSKEVQQAASLCSTVSKPVPLATVVYPWGQLILPCHDWVKQICIPAAITSSVCRQQSAAYSSKRQARTS